MTELLGYSPDSPRVVIDDDGNIRDPADFPDLDLDTEELSYQTEDLPLTDGEQALVGALAQPEVVPEEVQLILDAREEFRNGLTARGYTEDRINSLTSREYGATIARLAMQYDMTPYLATDEDEADDAAINMPPQRSGNAESEYERERDVRERQAGPDS